MSEGSRMVANPSVDPSVANVRKPDFFIVGGLRCGTTAMSEYLRLHPDIFVTDADRPIYFGSDLKKTPTFVYYQHDLNWYLSLFTGGRDKARAGEVSQLYLPSKRAAAEIKAFSPSAKIIIMLRNPIDMMYSLHTQLVSRGQEDIKDFESALEAEPGRIKGLGIPSGCAVHDILFYRELTKFSDHVGRYFEAFGRQNVHVVIFDDFSADTPASYAETLRFLEVDPEFQPQLDPINESFRVRSPILRYLWIHRPRFLQNLLLDNAHPSLPRAILIRTLLRLYSRSETRRPLDAELRKRLQAEFSGEVERLGKLLGRDLTQWCTD